MYLPTIHLTKAPNITTSNNFHTSVTLIGNLLIVTLRADDLRIDGNFSAYKAGSAVLPFSVKTLSSSRSTITSDAFDFEFAASVSNNTLSIDIGRGSGNNLTLRNASLYCYLVLPLDIA